LASLASSAILVLVPVLLGYSRWLDNHAPGDQSSGLTLVKLFGGKMLRKNGQEKAEEECPGK
jgi:hypothetical protein